MSERTDHSLRILTALLALTATAFPDALEEKAKKIVITLDFKDLSATDALKRIEKLSGVKIKYTAPATDPKVSVNLKNIPVSEALKYVTSLANLRFRYAADAVEVKAIE